MAGLVTRLGVGIGLSTLAAAVVIGFAPELLATVIDPGEFERLAAGPLGRGLLALALVAGVVLALWKGMTARPRSREPLDAGAEPIDGASPIGAEFDEALAGISDRRGWRNRRSVRERCFAVAVETVAAVEGSSQSTAEERIDAGAWTDDPIAAEFLGDERAPDAPLRWRLYRWLYPDRAFERAVGRTIDAVEAYDRSRTGSTPPVTATDDGADVTGSDGTADAPAQAVASDGGSPAEPTADAGGGSR